MLFMLNKTQSSDDSQDDCLFTVSIHNSHGNKQMGTFLFYREECLITFNDASLEMLYPACRLPKGAVEVGPYPVHFLNRDPIASVRATLRSATKGLFRRRRFGEFSIQAEQETDHSIYRVEESWLDSEGHLWLMVNEAGEPMVAVRASEPERETSIATYHIYVTERLNLKFGLILAANVMMLEAGLFPFGPKYITPIQHGKALEASPAAQFIAKAEQDEWGLFGATEGGNVSLPDT